MLARVLLALPAQGLAEAGVPEDLDAVGNIRVGDKLVAEAGFAAMVVETR